MIDMTSEKILEYVKLKMEKLEKDREMILDKMLSVHSPEKGEMLKEEYLKTISAYYEIMDIRDYIELGVNMDGRIKVKEGK